MPTTESSLVCRVGGRLCALPVGSVDEVLRLLPIEPVANVPSFVLGLCIIRGTPTPVVDAGRLLGDAHPPELRYLVSLKVGERRVALAVSSCVGVHLLAAADVIGLPPMVSEESGLVAALAVRDARLLEILDTARLLPADTVSAIEGAAA